MKRFMNVFRDKARLAIGLINIDVDNGVFHFEGKRWMLVDKDNLSLGLIVKDHTLLSLHLSLDATDGGYCLSGRKRGRHSGVSFSFKIPKVGRIQAFVIGRSEDQKELEYKYGLLHHDDAEGLYWGSKRIEFGNPSWDSIVWGNKR